MCDGPGYASESLGLSSSMGLSSVMAARGREAIRPVQIDHVLDTVSIFLSGSLLLLVAS